MSPWDWYPRAPPKKPPPAHGIKVKKAGATWWGQRWIEALEGVLGGAAARLARGRTYARAGRTHDLVVARGKVAAKVTGSRATPYAIGIEVTALSDAAWAKAIAGMAEKAQFAAELLAGQMPKEIDAVFRAAGAALFPAKRADLATRCSCPDWGDPCKHVAATHYVLGDAIDRDPFLLFELRGRTKAQILDALRAARTGAAAPAPPATKTAGRAAKAAPAKTVPAKTTGTTATKGRATVSRAGGATRRAHGVDAAAHEEADETPAVALGKMTAADYERPRAALPALHFSFDAPVTHGAVLRQLGVPPSWQSAGSPADALAPLVRAAAETARRIAMAEGAADVAPDGAPDADAHASRTARPRVTKVKGGTRRRAG